MRPINIKVVDFLRKTKSTVLFSGGKDSLALLLFMLDYVGVSADWNILYIEVTGNTAQECTEYVKKICERLGVSERLMIVRREDLDFYQCLKSWGIPCSRKSRWCFWQFKERLIEKHARPVQVSGIKKSDSNVRRNIEEIGVFWRKNITVKPLANWSKEDVLDYIKERGLELNPCYKAFGHSGNCVFCPYYDKRSIRLTMQHPYWRKKILDALNYINTWSNLPKFSKYVLERWLKEAKNNSILLYTCIE